MDSPNHGDEIPSSEAEWPFIQTSGNPFDEAISEHSSEQFIDTQVQVSVSNELDIINPPMMLPFYMAPPQYTSYTLQHPSSQDPTLPSETNALGLTLTASGQSTAKNSRSASPDLLSVSEDGNFPMLGGPEPSTEPNPWIDKPRKHPLVQSGRAYICTLEKCFPPGTIVLKKRRRFHDESVHEVLPPDAKADRKRIRKERGKEKDPYQTAPPNTSYEQPHPGPSNYSDN